MAIKVRDFEVRLTRNKEERKQVRQLRYKVFVEEEGAGVTDEQRALGEEYDAYDRYAEYMAVFHQGRVVGTYRIIDRNAAEKMDGFYTENEFNIERFYKILFKLQIDYEPIKDGKKYEAIVTMKGAVYNSIEASVKDDSLMDSKYV